MPRISSVSILEFRRGFAFGCIDCGRIFARGTFALVLKRGDDMTFIGPDEPVMCCGNKKISWLAFATKAEAEKDQERILSIIDRDHGVQNLRVVEARGFPFPPNPADN